MIRLLTLVVLGLMAFTMRAQSASQLTLKLDDEPLVGAEVRVPSLATRAISNLEGVVSFVLTENDTILVSHPDIIDQKVYVRPGMNREVTCERSRSGMLNQVVVTGTRTHLDRRESAVPVQVMSRDLLQATQSVSVAEGLAFRPGLRMEYNCQNCGFSQVRLNGLHGFHEMQWGYIKLKM